MQIRVSAEFSPCPVPPINVRSHTPPPPPIHPLQPFIMLSYAFAKRTSYRNFAFQNINTCVPRPQGEKGLIQRSEEGLFFVMKNARHTSGTGVLWQRRLCLSNYKPESFTTGKQLGNRREKDRGMVETRNGGENMGGKKSTDEISTDKKKISTDLWVNKGLR